MTAKKPEEIRSFYERMPYPAPLTNLDRDMMLLKNPERRRVRSLLMFPSGEPRSPQQILVAGCGTSQAARVALREPDARVLAIDISITSLNYLRALQQKYALDNLQIRQMSILDVSALKLEFDQIICTGVLHHLPDPDRGLRCLREVLDHNGAMQIMVYATYGRAGIYMMQDYCRLLGINPSHNELNTLCEALKCLPDDHPLTALLYKVKDFRNPDALADALLHPQDRAYTVPQIYEWLDRCGMSFGRWVEQAPYLPQCGGIASTPHATRIVELPEPGRYAAVELFRGTMTQHNFIAYRSDRAQTEQPIQFAGEQWRNYVPVRVPWTKIVRERIPNGSAGVLLNSVHKYSDLFLPIDTIEDGLFALIDGKRTIGEIERDSANGKDATRVRSFFERLWQHDLIVIDASQKSEAARLVEHRSYENV